MKQMNYEDAREIFFKNLNPFSFQPLKDVTTLHLTILGSFGNIVLSTDVKVDESVHGDLCMLHAVTRQFV